jgi:hypothetical protein
MKTYYPTAEEFENPITYIEQIIKLGASEHGCIKIKPPAGYNPPLAFDTNSDKKLPTRF